MLETKLHRRLLEARLVRRRGGERHIHIPRQVRCQEAETPLCNRTSGTLGRGSQAGTVSRFYSFRRAQLNRLK